jgi:hypothetical protein
MTAGNMVFNNFTWKPGTQVPVSASVAGKELDRIRTSRGGYFKPEDVVDESRPANAPLHNVFEWNDTVAAEAYRVDQARYIIRGIVVRPMNDPDAPPIRPIVSIVKEDDNEKPQHYYTGMAYALSEPDLRKQVLANALRDAQIFKDKWSQLTELSGVIKEIDRVQANMRNDLANDDGVSIVHPVRQPEKKPDARAYIPRSEVDRARRAGGKRANGRLA